MCEDMTAAELADEWTRELAFAQDEVGKLAYSAERTAYEVGMALGMVSAHTLPELPRDAEMRARFDGADALMRAADELGRAAMLLLAQTRELAYGADDAVAAHIRDGVAAELAELAEEDAALKR